MNGNSYRFSLDEYLTAELREQYIRALESHGKRPSRDAFGLEWQARKKALELRRELGEQVRRDEYDLGRPEMEEQDTVGEAWR